jgi:hypothetical protein
MQLSHSEKKQKINEVQSFFRESATPNNYPKLFNLSSVGNNLIMRNGNAAEGITRMGKK